MGEIKVGTASWTDKTLLESGWYPATADTPEKRLAYYARQFPLVEVDATYYAPPAEQTAGLWAQRTPAGFTFNIKAFSLLTGHPTKVERAPQGPAAGDREEERLPRRTCRPQAYEEVWTRFLTALDPLVEAGKLGALLFQFPPWFTIRRSNKQYLLEVAARCQPLRRVFEFRHASWFEGDNQAETLAFLREHRPALRLSSTCRRATSPRSRRCSRRPSDLAVVRFHGHSDKWTSKDIYEKFGYLYSERELAAWAPRLTALAEQTQQTHVLMNNCYSDYAQRNASELRQLLEQD